MWNYIKHLLGCNSNGFYRVKYTFVISEFEMIIKKIHLILTTWREKRLWWTIVSLIIIATCIYDKSSVISRCCNEKIKCAITCHNSLQNYDDDDEYIRDEPQSLDLSDDVSECGPVPDIVLTGFCKKKVCSSHDDCRKKNHRCCFNGCVKTCTRQPDPPPCTWFSRISRFFCK